MIEEIDLGTIMDGELSLHQHVPVQVNKANQTLELIVVYQKDCRMKGQTPYESKLHVLFPGRVHTAHPRGDSFIEHDNISP